MLSEGDVLLVHDRLVHDFAGTDDPVSPSGVRSANLLASAVSRQGVGFGTKLKYPSVAANAATLLYGLCNDHPFFNGNKRTALVSMLAHLDRNRMTLLGVGRDELFQMMLDVADHRFRAHAKGRERRIDNVDEEVAEIAAWIEKRLYRYQVGERQITYRQLRRILSRFSYVLENPDSGQMDLVRLVQVKRGIFRPAITTERRRIGSIPYQGENRFVGISLLKHIRRKCGLTETDGCDAAGFYQAESDEGAMVDGFINEYRTVLRRLARR